MTHDELSIDEKSTDGGETLVFGLRGSLDLATAPAFRTALIAAREKGCLHLIADLTRLEFLDSTGLGVLIGAHRRAAEGNGWLRLIVSEGAIARLLNITGLMTVFAVYHAEQDAQRDRNRVTAAL